MAGHLQNLLKLGNRSKSEAQRHTKPEALARLLQALTMAPPASGCTVLSTDLVGMLATLPSWEARLEALEQIVDQMAESLARLETIPEGRDALTAEVLDAARSAAQALERLRQAYASVFLEGLAGRTAGSGLPRLLGLAALRACQFSYRRVLLAARTYAELGPEHWRCLVELYEAASSYGAADSALAEDSSDSISRYFVRTLLIHLADPAALNRRALESLRFYVERYAQLARISTPHDSGDGTGCFIAWPPEHGMRALAQHGDHKHAKWLLDCKALLEKLSSQLDGLASGGSLTRLGLPSTARDPEYIALLRRLQTRWTQPSSRQQERKRVLPRIDVVIGFTAVRDFMKHHSASNSRPDASALAPFPCHEWELADRSENGLGLIYQAAQPQAVEIGELVAVRPQQAGDLQLGIVRRVLHRSGHETQIGIELLSGAAIAARFRPPCKADARERGNEVEPVSILFLPSVHTLDGVPALLAPCGQVELGTPIALPQRRGLTRFEVLACIERFARCELLSLRQAPLAQV